MYVIEREGTAPPVLALHGFCQSSAYWVPTLEALAKFGIGALALDLPGFGGSAKLPGPYTMEAYADAVASWLDARGIDRIRLVGGSMGGVVAQHFAIRHPHRLTRLLLVATGAFTANPAAALARADMLEAEPWTEETLSGIVAGFFHTPPEEAALAGFRHIAGMADRHAAAAAARSNGTARSFERLGEITVPTLIIQGGEDRGRTPAHGAEMRDRIPGARLEVLPGAGHTPQLEKTEAFHALALPFLMEAAAR